MKQFTLALTALFILALPAQIQACPNANCPMGKDCPYENCADCPSCSKGAAGKQGNKAMRGSFFDSADTNKDGMLSKEEFLAAKKAGWHKRRDCPLNEKSKK